MIASTSGRAFLLFVALLMLAHTSGGPAPTPITTASISADTANEQIAFVSDREGHDDIYLMNGDGSGQQRLTSTSNAHTYPQWSPDGEQLAFSSYTTDDDGRITAIALHTINADGSGELNLTADLSDRGITSFAPAWSPDGQRIAFSGNDVTQLGVAFNTSNVYVVNRDGSNLRQLTDEPVSNAGCWSPHWLPDSTHLVATCTALMLDWLLLIDSTDGSQERVLEDAADPDDLAVSPTGDWLAFIGAFGLALGPRDAPDEWDVYRLPEEDYSPIGFAWSSIEETVLVVQTDQALYLVANLDAPPRWLADASNPTNGAYSGPIWSSDGAQVVYVDHADGDAELFRLDLDTGETVRLTDNDADDYQATWRP